jgi:uncharacterized membrane protein
MEFAGSGAPHMEFRARDFRRIARDKLKRNWGIAIGTSILFMLCCWATGSLASHISSLLGADVPFFTLPFLDGGFYRIGLDYINLMQYIYDYDSLIQYISKAMPAVGVYSLLALMLSLAATAINFVMTLGHLKFYTDVCNSKAKLSTLFSRFRIFFKAFGLILFMRLFIFLWSLLLFIPGLIAYYRYSMAPYLMAQHPEMGIREAVNESKRLMKGHKGRLFCLQLSFLGWVLLCFLPSYLVYLWLPPYLQASALAFYIGYLWLVPYLQASCVAFYLDRSGQGIPLNAKPKPAVMFPDNGSRI